MKKFINLFSIILMAVIAVMLLVSFTGMPVILATGTVLAVGTLIPMPKNVTTGVVLEVWANYIIERFFKDNQFLRKAYDDSPYVTQGRIVHIPQPGAKPAVEKNRAVFPGTAVRRTDTDILYSLDEYTTDPTHIPNIDSVHLSYDKQDSVLGDHMQVIDETVADDMLIKWATDGTVVKTTGGDDAVTVSPITGQTGNRFGFHHRDLQKLMIKMNVDNVPKQKRNVLIDDNMFDYFYTSLGENQQRDFSKYANAEDGIVGRLHGFNIYTRSSVLLATSGDAVKSLGAAIASTDSLASFAWQEDCVAFAIGDHKLYQDLNNPLYYGDIHSLLIMAGGRRRRADNKGVYIISQGTPEA